MTKLTLLIISASALLVAYVWMTHPFEVPDENAHYASLHFLANEGRMPTVSDKDNLSIEEMQVEKVFGIVEGRNKYSYHPEFRVEQVEGQIGKYETYIHELNVSENRESYATHQAALYPPLYYWLALPYYQIAQKGDILTRLFAARFASVVFTLFTILVAYYLGRQYFKEQLSALTVAFMTL